MKKDIQWTLIFAVTVAVGAILEYCYSNSIVVLLNFVVLPLGFFFLFIMHLVNGIQRFTQNKIFSFVPFLLIIATFFLLPFLSKLIIKIDFNWHLQNRIKAVNYILESKESNQKYKNIKISIPQDIGYVSKAENNVWVEIDSNNVMIIRFPIKKGFMGGALPDLNFVYTSSNRIESFIEDHKIKLQENWYLEEINN
ncbi:hypothetical protein Q0590_37090 [Rhodocytophaga aerolata]|uniref:Uncharacterized protein n=1 Tax=Rhodocytophaga aerolata TaxID=455078 RepID=A0ABT8RK73_9BACT|nr:hypothetical protein [Rhodocytophaga aerolata]MDO1451944.1 hypothetical protein [Rhodocytophaga aerolata]